MGVVPGRGLVVIGLGVVVVVVVVLVVVVVGGVVVVVVIVVVVDVVVAGVGVLKETVVGELRRRI